MIRIFALIVCFLIGAACVPHAAHAEESIKALSAEDTALYEKSRTEFEKEETCQKKPGKKDVLIIGDSISMGYTNAMVCQDEFLVMHNAGNASSTWLGRAIIHEWLAHKKHWDLIVFNFGIHDLHDNGLDKSATSKPEEYETNLNWIVARLKQEKVSLLFVNTTPVPGDARVVQYNEIAAKVMKEQGVPVFDLYSVAKPLDDLRERKNGKLDTHFKTEGYLVLSHAVADAIREHLSR